MSHEILSCPGCKSKIRFNPKAGRTEIKCPRCRHVITVSATGSVKVQETQSMPIQRAGKQRKKDADSNADMAQAGQETPADEKDVVSDSSPKSRRSRRASADAPASAPSRFGILGRTEVQMFLIGLVSALVIGYSGLALFVTLRSAPAQNAQAQPTDASWRIAKDQIMAAPLKMDA